MSWIGDVFFYLCAAVATLTALATILVKSPIRAAVGLFGHVLALAGLYLTLHAHLIAALQLIVYAGAVVVLFVFVIMMLGPTPIAPSTGRGLVVRSMGAAVMGLLAAGLAFALVEVSGTRGVIPLCPPGAPGGCDQFGGVEALGRELFVGGVVPFEVVSFLLLVAVVGAIAVARGRSAAEAAEAKARRLAAEAAAAAERDRERALSAEVAAHEGHGH